MAGESKEFSIKTRIVFSQFLSCTDSDEFWNSFLQNIRIGLLKTNIRGDLTD